VRPLFVVAAARSFAFAFFAFALALAFADFAPFLGLEALRFAPRERERTARFRAGAAGAFGQPQHFAVEEVADREEVGDVDDRVELVGIAVDVVELLLAVGPGDVLVGAEPDPRVVLRRRQQRGVGAAVLLQIRGRARFRVRGAALVARDRER